MSESPQPPPGGEQTHHQPSGPPVGAAQPLTDAETRQWAGLSHLGGILGFLPALIIWLVYKDRSPFVDQEAKKALNFQIVSTVTYIVAAIFGSFIPFIGFLLPLAVWAGMLILAILGFQAVNRGQAYTYPINVELVK